MSLKIEADKELDEVLKRLLADVDDVMELQGTIWKPNKDAERDVFIKLAKARDNINALVDKAIIAELEALNSSKLLIGNAIENRLNQLRNGAKDE